MNPKISEKQSAFIDHYLANGFNATRAAISAGYSAKTAQEQSSVLLSKPIIKSEIERRKKPIANKLNISRENLVLELMDIKAKCLEEDPASGKFAQYNNALKALEMVARMLGLNEPDKLEVNLKAELIPDFGDDSNE